MSCIPILTSASTPFILGKSRMRKRARTDLCGGRSAMVVPTATVGQKKRPSRKLAHLYRQVGFWKVISTDIPTADYAFGTMIDPLAVDLCVPSVCIIPSTRGH